jgi:hypothetical protein
MTTTQAFDSQRPTPEPSTLDLMPNPPDPSDYLVPARAIDAGFSNEPIGTHTGKTMMLSELRQLLAATSGPVAFAEYQRAAVEENALGKATAANRSNTLKYLKQLYGLRPEITVFSAMRALWDARTGDQPSLALLCAQTRDVLFRSTAPIVLEADLGSIVSATSLSEAIALSFPHRYAKSSLRNLGQNIASSWTQSGLLGDGRDKQRTRPSVDMAAVAYALYLSHLEGLSGPPLFRTRWTRLLDRSVPELEALAEAAARSGWLEYRSSGGMVEITFKHLDGLTGRGLG